MRGRRRDQQGQAGAGGPGGDGEKAVHDANGRPRGGPDDPDIHRVGQRASAMNPRMESATSCTAIADSSRSAIRLTRAAPKNRGQPVSAGAPVACDSSFSYWSGAVLPPPPTRTRLLVPW